MYEVTVSGGTLDELAANLNALAGQFQTTAATPPAKAATPRTKAPAKAPEPEPEVVEEAKTLDFNTDVAPVVIATVSKLGKDAVVSILEEFGAGRASDVPPEQWGELLTKLNDAAEQAVV